MRDCVSRFFRAVARRPKTVILGLVLLLGTGTPLTLWQYHLYHVRAARGAAEQGRYADAQTHLDKAFRVWPASGETHLLAARIARRNRKYDEAESHLKECLRRQGTTELLQLEWVLLRAEQGEIDEVASGLWLCVEKGDPETSQILETLALTYLRQQRFLLARTALERWLQKEPDCVQALDWRGWVRERTDDRPGAIQDYEHALRLDSGNDEVRLRLVSLLLDAEQLPQARSHLKRLCERCPDRAEVRTGLARCAILRGEADKARELLEGVLAEQPRDLEALFYRGQLELELGKPKVAEGHFRRLLRVDPSHVQAHYSLYLCLRQQNRPEAEIKAQLAELEKVTKDARHLNALLGHQGTRIDDPDVASEVGSLFIRLGQPQLGVKWLYRALERDPDHKASHEALIKYFEQTKDEKNAKMHRDYLASKASGKKR